MSNAELALLLFFLFLLLSMSARVVANGIFFSVSTGKVKCGQIGDRTATIFRLLKKKKKCYLNLCQGTI